MGIADLLLVLTVPGFPAIEEVSTCGDEGQETPLKD
jgi:hypothetical protein